jgi:hypothetical protein
VPARFLELSVSAASVAAALEFYESLGFVQASVGDAWSHPYAVVTDGRATLGLHGLSDPAEPRLTFVTPDLRTRLDELARTGIEIERARLDDVSLNKAEFRDPTGLHVRLLEARTFSPPAIEPVFESELGYFEGYVAGATDLAEAGQFWERLGFVAFLQADDDAPPRLVASHRDVNVTFVDADLASPMLCFSANDMPQRITRLRERGHVFAPRVPRPLQQEQAAVLHAPDAVQVLLVQSEA